MTGEKPILGLGLSRVLLSHGGGGSQTEALLGEHLFPHLIAPHGERRGDSAILSVGPARIAFTTDSFVVKPWRFPGGDIGRLAVCGTVNDLTAAGARPQWLSLGLILEEGFAAADLASVAVSIQQAATEASVEIVTGDTKVVERGRGDGIYINTAGIGIIEGDAIPHLARAEPGDTVIVTGTVGDHGAAIMQARESFGLVGPVASDVAPLGGLIDSLRAAGVAAHVLKDPTRGGLAMAANEIAEASGVAIRLDERALPVKPSVARLLDLLGLDVFEVANEGKMIVIVPPGEAEPALRGLRAHPLGREAAVIGEVSASGDAIVTVTTRAGGERMLIKPAGEALPRIC